MQGKNYLYVRVSTNTQDVNRQISDLLNYVEQKKLGEAVIVRETISGRANVKPELERVLTSLKKGDRVLVSEFSRLTRRGSTELGIIAKRIIEKGAELYELSGNIHFEDNALSEMYLSILGAVARMEREAISERTKSALAERKRKGVKLGRPKGSKLEQRKAEIKKYQDLGLNKTSIAKLLGVARGTYINFLNSGGKNEAKKVKNKN